MHVTDIGSPARDNIQELPGQHRVVPAASIACDLLAWLRLLALDGDLAHAEPKTLRYRVLHAAARLTRGSAQRR